MNTLKINTSDNKKITVGLEIYGKTFYLSSRTQLLKAQAVLPLIDKILKKNDLTFKDINNIQVNTGPGSFTGLKVGVAIANGLSLSLLKKINNKELGDFEVPQY